MRRCFILFVLLLTAGCNSNTARHPNVKRLDGTIANLSANDFNSRVFLFVKTDCPIGNRYAPKIVELAKLSDGFNLKFALVYPDKHLTTEAIEAHQNEFGLTLPTYRDPEHELVRTTGASRAPEAVVYNSSGVQVYRGRIDNRYVDFGKARPAPTSNDLRNVIESLGQGKRLTPRITEAVGCYLD
ncbi:MAG: hypothetical protein AAF497_15740 [Planctomycetota bacterium]